ncbi:hypothetical protein [Saccharothrix hoggarensis]|uniref:Uncharacterized protein n=1 Tax=Saccharothrix hoggarensis TaxID=913853 RepID=A0ABW3QID6_9PSEU
MVLIVKKRAGGDSFGNRWEEDGAAVDVPPEQAAALLVIPDGGFSEQAEPEAPAGDVPEPPTLDVEVEAHLMHAQWLSEHEPPAVQPAPIAPQPAVVTGPDTPSAPAPQPAPKKQPVRGQRTKE